jgi:hypothetical protein
MLHDVGRGRLELDNGALVQLGKGGEGGEAARRHELREGAVAQHVQLDEGGGGRSAVWGARAARGGKEGGCDEVREDADL